MVLQILAFCIGLWTTLVPTRNQNIQRVEVIPVMECHFFVKWRCKSYMGAIYHTHHIWHTSNIKNKTFASASTVQDNGCSPRHFFMAFRKMSGNGWSGPFHSIMEKAIAQEMSGAEQLHQPWHIMLMSYDRNSFMLNIFIQRQNCTCAQTAPHFTPVVLAISSLVTIKLPQDLLVMAWARVAWSSSLLLSSTSLPWSLLFPLSFLFFNFLSCPQSIQILNIKKSCR